MEVLVTGGRGFLGTHVCAGLRKAGHEPLPLGRTEGELAEHGTIERLLAEHEPDVVVRLRSLGWRPEIPLEEGIRSMLHWLREAA